MGTKLPNLRQTVPHRAEDTWRDLRHFKATEKRWESCGEEQETQSERSDECDAEGGDPNREWKENGYGLALDGSEDHMLRSDLYHLWQELEMPALR